MKREEIICMAMEAGMDIDDESSAFGAIFTAEPSDLERFAALVAAKAKAKEREACAQIVDANAERCGTVIRLILESNAAAIRARGVTSSMEQT